MLLVFIATLISACATIVAADCSRDILLATANSYVAAQIAGKTDSLKLSTSDFTYQENNKATTIAKALISTPLKLDLNRSTADSVDCASYTMFISSTGSKPYVVSTQIRHADGDPSTITMIDSIVATTGSLFFDAKQTLSYIQKESWTPLANGTYPSRTLLKAYGDAYLDMWTNATAAGSISWGTDCERVEGSRLTKPCGASLPHGGSAKANGNRRYVVDEVMGSVDVLCEFSSLGAWPDSHEIRVEGGKVKYVHTVTVE